MGVYFQRTRDARKAEAEASKDASEDEGGMDIAVITATWLEVFRNIPEFRILRLTFHRKLASKY